MKVLLQQQPTRYQNLQQIVYIACYCSLGLHFRHLLTGRVQGLDLRSSAKWTKKWFLCHQRSRQTGVTTDEPPTPLDSRTLHPKNRISLFRSNDVTLAESPIWTSG